MINERLMEKILQKIGFYTIYEKKIDNITTYKVDNGKTLFVARFNKIIPNPYRDIKEFKTLSGAKRYIDGKLKKSKTIRKNKLETLPKSLYFILMKEKKTGITFIKIGITSKKFILRRFSKEYGYEGYSLETILRRIDTPKAEEIEKKIHETLKKKKGVKKFRPLLESFGGYSECYDGSSFNDIAKVFDELTKDV